LDCKRHKVAGRAHFGGSGRARESVLEAMFRSQNDVFLITYVLAV